MVNRAGHSLAELIVAMTVLAAGLGAVSAASVVAMRRTNEALLKERAAVLAVATLDSLSVVAAPAAGTLHVPGIRIEWAVDASGDGGDIRLSAMPEGSSRWVQRFRARYLAPVPALQP